MNNYRGVLHIIIFVVMIFTAACVNTKIIDDASMKKQTALYYYEQRDYMKAKANCTEAI